MQATKQEKFFFCYNSTLAKYLKLKGFDYVTRAKHYRSNKEFTLYTITKELEKCIQEWNTNNKTR